MYQIIMVLHVIVALALIGLVLIQHGKGADIGAGLGTGASNTLFGSQGTGGFLFKLTGALALTFFLTSVLLSTLLASQYQAELPTLPAKVLPLALERPAPVDLKESKYSKPCRSGGIGRHAVLRGRWRKLCRFESGLRYQI